MPQINQHRRLQCENFAATLRLGEGRHELIISVARDDRGVPREVCFVGRGKIGQGLDDLLTELGIMVSRTLQGREPNGGEREGVWKSLSEDWTEIGWKPSL